MRVSFVVGISVVLTHLVGALVTPYELHRDEFLYLAMGRHLRLFAMDFPPLIAVVAEAERWLLGDTLVSIRMGPALAHGAVVVLAGAIARRMGGGAFAQATAAVAAAVAPLYLRAGSLLQPVVFEQLWWTLAAYGLVRVGAESRVDRDRSCQGPGFPLSRE